MQCRSQLNPANEKAAPVREIDESVAAGSILMANWTEQKYDARCASPRWLERTRHAEKRRHHDPDGVVLAKKPPTDSQMGARGTHVGSHISSPTSKPEVAESVESVTYCSWSSYNRYAHRIQDNTDSNYARYQQGPSADWYSRVIVGKKTKNMPGRPRPQKRRQRRVKPRQWLEPRSEQWPRRRARSKRSAKRARWVFQPPLTIPNPPYRKRPVL